MFREVEYMGIKFVVDESVLAVHQRNAALVAALRALVATEPLYTDSMSDACCCYCGASYDQYAKVHESDCPWLTARALVGTASPA